MGKQYRWHAVDGKLQQCGQVTPSLVGVAADIPEHPERRRHSEPGRGIGVPCEPAQRRPDVVSLDLQVGQRLRLSWPLDLAAELNDKPRIMPSVAVPNLGLVPGVGPQSLEGVLRVPSRAGGTGSAAHLLALNGLVRRSASRTLSTIEWMSSPGRQTSAIAAKSAPPQKMASRRGSSCTGREQLVAPIERVRGGSGGALVRRRRRS